MDLLPGANAALPAAPLAIDVTWRDGTGVDVSALLLGADGKVRGDADMVFFNNPESACGAVRFTAQPGTARIDIDPKALPADVERVALVAAVDVDAAPGTTFAQVAGLHAAATAGVETFAFAVPDLDRGETAAVLAEVYRRRRGLEDPRGRPGIRLRTRGRRHRLRRRRRRGARRGDARARGSGTRCRTGARPTRLPRQNRPRQGREGHHLLRQARRVRHRRRDPGMGRRQRKPPRTRVPTSTCTRCSSPRPPSSTRPTPRSASGSAASTAANCRARSRSWPAKPATSPSRARSIGATSGH
ncbi:TerD family protein [Yinghuangia aomiensis]